MLSDKDIKAALANGSIVVEPLEDPEIQIQPASIDLRLGNDFRVFKHAQRAYIDPLHDDTDDYTEVIHVDDGKVFMLHPGEFVLGSIKEYVKIPADIVAQVDGRSSLGRLAILVHATAGFIDPGFEGNITLELSNVGKMPVAFYPNMRVCQISFTYLSCPSERPYGHPSRRSKYQGQRGPTGSRIQRDAHPADERRQPPERTSP
ncbi:MAG TPA: dCTP deaminase [Armatimonadota bacterium]|jgi:dCTP deaminase